MRITIGLLVGFCFGFAFRDVSIRNHEHDLLQTIKDWRDIASDWEKTNSRNEATLRECLDHWKQEIRRNSGAQPEERSL